MILTGSCWCLKDTEWESLACEEHLNAVATLPDVMELQLIVAMKGRRFCEMV